jgi:hypothetical protein
MKKNKAHKPEYNGHLVKETTTKSGFLSIMDIN